MIENAVAQSLKPYGTTIFTEMTALAVRHGAVNLAQGFPDFDGPEVAKWEAIAAIQRGESQYARMFGLPRLNRAIASAWQSQTGAAVDPEVEVTVTSGCTEAIAATLLGVLNPGDRVVVFEPFYDSYRACLALAKAEPRFVTLRPAGAAGRPHFEFDEQELRRAFAHQPRAILLNTPHNPTGKVFRRSELELIAELCRQHGTLAITDEVYEHLTYDPSLPHVSLATLPGMAERTVTLSSLGKSFSLTGWKIGWAIAPPTLSAAVRAAHQFLTFATATPLQHGAAAMLEQPGSVVAETRALFRRNRDLLAECLERLGFVVFASPGTYFLLTEHMAISRRWGLADDREFCRWLPAQAGVAAIPPSAFYAHAEEGARFVRWAYCKRAQTIDEAVARLSKILG